MQWHFGGGLFSMTLRDECCDQPECATGDWRDDKCANCGTDCLSCVNKPFAEAARRDAVVAMNFYGGH